MLNLDLRRDRGGAGAWAAAHQAQDQDRLRQGAEGPRHRYMCSLRSATVS